MSPLPLNKTELLVLCEDLGYLDVHRRMSEKELHALLARGPGAVRLPVLRVNRDRYALMKLVLDKWENFHPLLSCPAKSGSPTACYSCTDLQVVYCVSLNQDHLQSVTVTKKDLQEMTKTNFTPLTAEEWTAIGEHEDKQERTKLMAGLVALGVKPIDASKLYPTVKEKVDAIMKKQEENGLVPANAKKAANKAPAAGVAAKVPAAATTKVGVKSSGTVPAAAGATGGSSVGNAEVAELRGEIAELKEMVSTLTDLVTTNLAFTKDAHAHTIAAFILEMQDSETAASCFGELTLEASSGND